jgi:hypothetical protein
MMFKFQAPARVAKLERRVLDLEAELAARDRVIRIQQAEIDQLAKTVARDVARVEAELAAHMRARAECEGNCGRAE